MEAKRAELSKRRARLFRRPHSVSRRPPHRFAHSLQDARFLFRSKLSVLSIDILSGRSLVRLETATPVSPFSLIFSWAVYRGDSPEGEGGQGDDHSACPDEAFPRTAFFEQNSAHDGAYKNTHFAGRGDVARRRERQGLQHQDVRQRA